MTTQLTTISKPHLNLNYFIRCLIACALILSNSLFANTDDTESSDDFIELSKAVPAGFEDLAGPQVNQIDVYYQGKFLTAADATYDFETLTFHQPEIIIESIAACVDFQLYVMQSNLKQKP